MLNPIQRCRRAAGFTLIELLIVVAIIAILALIALPNFLDAQTRAKVSRVQADMRSTATAIEAYAVDFSTYPIYRNALDFEEGGEWHRFVPVVLTTPVAYLQSLFNDVFPALYRHAHHGHDDRSHISPFHPFHYLNDQMEDEPVVEPRHLHATGRNRSVIWMLMSHGPDLDGDDAAVLYDPTNGTISDGDLARFGP
jgi:prepilin-type N-terminal cleavage/methylation domain-containing protein